MVLATTGIQFSQTTADCGPYCATNHSSKRGKTHKRTQFMKTHSPVSALARIAIDACQARQDERELMLSLTLNDAASVILARSRALQSKCGSVPNTNVR